MSEFFGLLMFVVVLLAGMVMWNSYECGAKWPDIQHRYGIVSGCMVNVPQKGWIPAANYRVI